MNAPTKLTDEQKTALRGELAEAMNRGTLANPTLEQARELARLCNDFIETQGKALALPVGQSQKNRPTARARAKHDALRERVIALAVEFASAEHLADLICRSLEPTEEAQTSLLLTDDEAAVREGSR